MLLRKTISLSDVSLKIDGDTGKFAGYASVFGGVDSYGDTIVKGAFESTLKKNGKPKMFFNHSWDMPIGKWTVAKEDDHGLLVEGELTPGLGLATDVRAAMKHGTLDGLSIGGFLKKGDYDETEGGRVIRRWSNLMEVSPVVFPADGAARIDLSSVKGEEFAQVLEEEIAGLETLREFECFLRDAGGLSKGAAKALTARAKVLFVQRDADDEPLDAKQIAELTAHFQRLATLGV
jgi:phage prohead protease, HK97 family